MSSGGMAFAGRREVTMLALLLFVVLNFAFIVHTGAVEHAPPEKDLGGGDDLDSVDLLEGIVGGEDDLPDEEDYGEYDGVLGYDDEIDPDADEHWRKEEEEFFKKYDLDGDGNLNLDEYKQLIHDEWHGDGGPDQDEGDEALSAQDHFNEEDANKDGMISLAEWMAVSFHNDPQEADYENGEGDYERLSEQELAEIRQEAMGEFQNSDKDQDGKLTLQEIINLVLSDIQEDEEHDINKDEMVEMAKAIFNEMDRNNDTVVDFDEFFQSHIQEPEMFDDDMDHDYYGPDHMEGMGMYDHDPDSLYGDEGEDGEDFDLEHLSDDRDMDDVDGHVVD